MRAALYSALGLAVCLGLAGCQSTPSTPLMPDTADIAFNPSEAAFIKKDGRATIAGEAFLREASGSIMHASGEVVRLIPETAYARERFARLYSGEKFVAARAFPKLEADPAYVSYTRTTKVDDRGKFTFERVPPGRYFIATQVTWKPAHSYSVEGGAIYETVTVSSRDDETTPVKVIVSGK